MISFKIKGCMITTWKQALGSVADCCSAWHGREPWGGENLVAAVVASLLRCCA